MNHIPNIPRQDEPPRWQRPSEPPPPPQPPRGREPMFTMPTSVIVMIAVLGIVHALRSQLSFEDDIAVLAWFAFIPARYASAWSQLPGGLAADVWTFVTYALLHGSVLHIVTNAIWLLAFGSAVARRFGAWRFWVFSAVAAAGGAGLHLVFHWGEGIPVVGASAAIAGLMAAATRFVFDRDGPLVFGSGGSDAKFLKPARPLLVTLRNRRALAFIVIWFAINLAVGLGSSYAGGLSIAWEAHLGGFLVGLLAFRLFDPVPR
ncbi:rhomboid family intramembrane serine protease [Acuticoccus sp. MNP-M23]|uniref:rhomboid family intramembrane serine protease n=1 Tax=Acuticoccus sp. MNP-M23 TaxID=3072793 RepID=UPI0028154AF8|nr:rhomboid family intramembrane serine protease [Acuticoccus sp. MNP-M23]WMS42506.1 rhomboid family intramembrane serine protease [Acuticoccus sp. MNP-M23]